MVLTSPLIVIPGTSNTPSYIFATTATPAIPHNHTWWAAVSVPIAVEFESCESVFEWRMSFARSFFPVRNATILHWFQLNQCLSTTGLLAQLDGHNVM